MRKIIGAILAGVMALGIAGCKKDDDGIALTLQQLEAIKLANAEKLELKIGEFYSIPGTTDSTNCRTSAEEVAFVRSNSIIVARTEGTAVITVANGTNEKLYSITVKKDTSDGDRLPSNFQSLDDTTFYIGSGYNALKASQYMTNSDLIINSIISQKDIVKASTRNFAASKGCGWFYEQIRGSNSKTYDEKYTKTLDGKLNVNIKQVVKGNASGKFNNLTSTSTDETCLYTTIFAFDGRYQYTLIATPSEMTELAKKNTSAWNDLTTNPDIEKVFDRYGTHILTGAIAGARAELDYKLTSKDGKKTENQLLDIAGCLEVDLKISGGGKAEAKYKDEIKKATVESQVEMKTSVSLIGGTMTTATFMDSLDTFLQHLPTWYGTVNDNTLNFIGYTSNGLMPIWDLLPNTAEYKDRRAALENKYKELKDK